VRFRVPWYFMELLILIVVIALVAFLALTRGEASLTGLIVNGILGVILIFLTNLVLSPPIPINIFTVLICAIGGVVGWLIIVVLHVLGIAF
jgi:sigmaK-factor processing regulatory protein BofA